MTNFQKVIKYGAIAFGAYLSFIIISIAVVSLTAFFSVFIGIDYFENSTSQRTEIAATDFHETFDQVERIDIDLAISNLRIEAGTEFTVSGTDVPSTFYARKEGTTLKVSDGKRNFSNINNHFYVTITIPDQKLREFNLESGVNKTTVNTTIEAEKADIETGVGNCVIENIVADKLDLSTGAGETIVNQAEVQDLTVEAGVGRCQLSTQVTRRADVEAGVGDLDITLLGNQSDYQIKAKTGLGNFTVDGKKVTDDQVVGNGKVIIRAEAGVGRTTIKFDALAI